MVQKDQNQIHPHEPGGIRQRKPTNCRVPNLCLTEGVGAEQVHGMLDCVLTLLLLLLLLPANTTVAVAVDYPANTAAVDYDVNAAASTVADAADADVDGPAANDDDMMITMMMPLMKEMVETSFWSYWLLATPSFQDSLIQIEQPLLVTGLVSPEV